MRRNEWEKQKLLVMLLVHLIKASLLHKTHFVKVLESILDG